MTNIFKKILSVICVGAITATFFVSPVFASGWNKIMTNDGTNAEDFFTQGARGAAIVNEEHGFIWHSKTGNGIDHTINFAPGIKGNFEVELDFFVNDIDNTYSAETDAGEHRIFLVQDESGYSVQCWSGLAYGNSIKTDDDTSLRIDTYAKASRKYGNVSDGLPTHLNLKITMTDGVDHYYAKWNTEENWREMTIKTTSTKWSATAETVLRFCCARYEAFDNIVLRMNIPPKATVDKTTVMTSDSITLTFNESIGTYPSTITFDDGKQATVTRVDEKTFTLTFADLQAVKEYTSSLSDFISSITGLGSDEELTFVTGDDNTGDDNTGDDNTNISAWNKVITNDGTSTDDFFTQGAGGAAVVNEEHGFIWHSKTGDAMDHTINYAPGIKGDFEVELDFFVNDIDNPYSAETDAGEHRIFLVQDESGYSVQCWSGLAYGNSIKTDDDTSLRIDTYAKASRKYGNVSDGLPTHLNLKITMTDGVDHYYAKWNTEENWREMTIKTTSTKWSATAETVLRFCCARYEAFDNIVLRMNIPPKATVDKTTVMTSDSITLTFNESIGTYPSTITFDDGKQATVTRVDEKTFTLTFADLQAVKEYTSSLAGFVSNSSGLGCVEIITFLTGADTLSETTYTETKTEDFDGESGIRWETTGDNVETGYHIENGVWTQTIENASATMRHYVVDDYYMEVHAYLDDEISFAMCNASGDIKNKVSFKAGDKLESGEYIFSSAISNGYAYWYATETNAIEHISLNNESDSLIFLGAYEIDLEGPGKPVVETKGLDTKIFSVSVSIKPTADRSEADALNAIIAIENAEMEKQERALNHINEANDIVAIEAAIGSDDMNGYADPFFAEVGSKAPVYKTAYAEFLLSARNELVNQEFKDLAEYEKYSKIAINILKISEYTGDNLADALTIVKHESIKNDDADYVKAKHKIAIAFESLRGTKIFKNYEEIKNIFVEAKALGVLNAAETRDDIPYVINTYGADLGISADDYGNLSAELVNVVLLNKGFASKSDVKKAIEDRVIALKNASSGSNGGSSSSSGGSSGASKGTFVVTGTTNSTGLNNVGGMTSSEKKKFNDIDDVAWAKDAIDSLAQKGVISGVTDTTFEPSRNVTRAEFVKMIVGGFGLVSSGTKKFKDVDDNAWFAEYVNIVASNGIVNGVSETEFAPNSAIIRQDAALIIFKCAANWNVVKSDMLADIDDVSSYAEEAVRILYQSQVISGDDDGIFAPKRTITRAEAACMIYKALEVLNKI